MDKPVSVLVLDDEANVLKALQRAFFAEPYSLFTTTDPQIALEYLRNNSAKVIMSDQRMPNLSGVDFLSSARQIRPEAVRILFTGYTDIRSAEDAINKGHVYRFVNKPWDDAEMIRILRDAIQRYDLFMENKRLHEITRRQNEELLQANGQLRHSMAIQAEFTSTISHELRTPLTSIKTGIELVQKGYCGPINEKQNEYLSRVTRSVGRLNRLINDVLDFSKMASNKAVFEMRPLDLTALLNEVAENHKPVAEKKGLALSCVHGDQVPVINADADKLYQLFNNLIHNAIKFTPKGSVTIRCEAAPEEVMVRVEDTGPGISKEDQTRIFKEFEQLGTAADRVEGTGLGLAICKKIVEGHGGRITVESQPGVGSGFIVHLPIQGGTGHVG